MVTGPAKQTRTLRQPRIFEVLSTSEGVPHIYIRDFVQDRQGFLWIATQGGLGRYDGYEIRSYVADPENPKALKTNYLTALALGLDGKLWIGTGENGLSVYDPGTDSFSHYEAQGGDAKAKETPSVVSNGIVALHADPQGNIWIGADDGVLSKLDPKAGTFRHFRGIQELESQITSIAQADEKSLWVGTSDAGLLKLDADTGDIAAHFLAGQPPTAMSSNDVRSIFVDQDGYVWIATAEGLNRLDPKTKAFTYFRHRTNDRSSLNDDRTTSVFEDRSRRLWVGTESGLNVLGKDRRTWVQYVKDPSDQTGAASYPGFVSTIFQDRGGVLWFGSRHGIYKLHDLRMKFRPHMNIEGEPIGASFTEGDPGIIWAGSYNSGLTKLDRNNRQMIRYMYFGDPRSSDWVNLTAWISALHQDKRGTLWISGTGLGLIRFHVESEKYKQYLPASEDDMNGPTADWIMRIVEDKNGHLWLATWGGGLNRFDPEDESFLDFTADDEDPKTISANHIYTLHLDSKDPNLLWVGTARGGLNKFDIKSQEVTRYNVKPEGATQAGYDSILSIHQSQDGTLWLGTDGAGLVHFDPKTSKTEYITDYKDLTHVSLFGILADDEGKLWISTDGKGLVVYDPVKKTAITYTEADGLTGNEFVQNGYYRSSTGEMFFNTGNGFNAFNPAEIQPDPYVPPPILTRFQLFNKDAELEKPIWMTTDLDLNYTDSVFSFEFAAISFAAPENTLYSYKLEGLHDWVESDRRFVTYTNLDGGDYEFLVKAANHHGVWSETMATIKLHVAPPPWKTWWAYTLYALGVVGIVFAYMRYQARKVESLRQAHRLEAVERDLELTGAVQSGFLPRSNNVHSEHFRLFGFYRPADQAGGDWWWYEESGSKLTIVVGDVTGHGAGPAMVTAAAATAFRIQGKNRNLSLADRLATCNEEVLRVGGGSYQMTMSVLELDGVSGRFAYYSAGGLPIIRILYDGKPRSLTCSGTPLGSAVFEVGRIDGSLVPGERLMMYTDGIPEMPVGQGRQLGIRKFAMICESTRDLSLPEAVQKIAIIADTIRQNSPQYDDWTFAMVEWPVPGVAQVAQHQPTPFETATNPGQAPFDRWSKPSQLNMWLNSGNTDGGPGDSSSGSGKL